MATYNARSISVVNTPQTSGTIAVSSDGLTLTLSGSTFQSHWGRGDKISVDGGFSMGFSDGFQNGEDLYIASVISNTQVTVQVAASVALRSTSGNAYQLERAYTSIASWYAACPADLRTPDLVWEGICYKDGGVFNERLAFTSSIRTNNYAEDRVGIWLYADSANRHTGTKGTGVVIKPTANNPAWTTMHIVTNGGISIEWLEFDGSGVTNWYGLYGVGGLGLGFGASGPEYGPGTIKNCLIYSFGNSLGAISSSYGVTVVSFTTPYRTSRIHNCALFECGKSGNARVMVLNSGSSTLEMYNCSLDGLVAGASIGGSGVTNTYNSGTIINTLATNFSTCFNGFTKTYCLSSDATAGAGTGCLNSIPSTSVLVTENPRTTMNLLVNSSALNVGTPLGTTRDVNYDIHSLTRTGYKWSIGADRGLQTSARSIGSYATPYSTGTITINTATTITLVSGTFDTARWGEGDKITIDGEVNYIRSIDSATTATLWSMTSKTGSGKTYQIERCYSTFATWNSACPTNLLTVNELWKGMAYKDSTFSAGCTMTGVTADANRYMWLTANSGQRHTGTAGTGVTVSVTTNQIFSVGVSYTVIENLALTGVRNTSDWQNCYGFHVSAGYVTVRRNLIYGFFKSALADGVNLMAVNFQGNGANYSSILNNIIYDINIGTSGYLPNAFGIRIWECYYIVVRNNTIYSVAGTGRSGIYVSAYAGCAYTQNNIAMDCGVDFYLSPISASWGTVSHNMSSDTTAPGTSSLTSKTASNQFVSTTPGSENLHLNTATSDAIRKGIDLGTTSGVDIDIDGLSRLLFEGGWDIGADEIYVRYGVGVLNSQAPTISGSGYASVVGYGDLTSQAPQMSGFGISTHTGQGQLNSNTPEISGSCLASCIGSGSLNGQSCLMTGAGVSTHTGSGQLLSQTPLMSGECLSTHQSSGQLTCQTCLLSGTGLATHVGSGSLISNAPEISGTCILSHMSSGDLVCQICVMSGTGISTHTGPGVLYSQAPSVSGSCLATHTGSGILSSQLPLISGSCLSTHGASGNLIGQNCNITGSGIATHTGSGQLTDQNSEISGLGLSTHQGSGVLQSQNSEMSGQCLSSHQSSGQLECQSCSMTGVGLSTHIGSGELDAGQCEIHGESHTDGGVLVCGHPDIVGQGISTHHGDGILLSSYPYVSADCLASHPGSGNIYCQPSQIGGIAISSKMGSGSLICQSASISGSGICTKTGSGVLYGSSPSISGVGISTHVGSGSLNSQAPSLSGTGIFLQTGSGSLISGHPIISGSGIETKTGSGLISPQHPHFVSVAYNTIYGAGILAPQSNILYGRGIRSTITGKRIYLTCLLNSEAFINGVLNNEVSSMNFVLGSSIEIDCELELGT